MISARCASVSLALLGSLVRPTSMTAILTPAKTGDHAAMESILSLVTVLMVLLETCVKQTSTTVLLTPAKMEDHAAMELILLPVTVLMVLLERSVMVCVCVCERERSIIITFSLLDPHILRMRICHMVEYNTEHSRRVLPAMLA